MSDQIIFDVDGLIEAQIRQRDKDYAKVCCQNLLNYAYGKGLLCDNPCDNEGNLIMPSIIKESSLTEIGKHILLNCYLSGLHTQIMKVEKLTEKITSKC